MKVAVSLILGASMLYATDADKVVAGPPSHDFVVVNYDGQKVPPDLDAVLRYNTVIRIPAGESAMEASAGDAADASKPGSGDWLVVISREGDAVYVKPTRQSIQTNLEIRTDHGNRYTFFLADHSLDKGFHAHLEYIINPTGQTEMDAIKAPPKYVLKEKLDDAQADALRFKAEAVDLEAKWEKRFTQEQVAARQTTLTGLTCDYRIPKDAAALHIQNACHDHDWTYLWAKDAPEHFALADTSTGSSVAIIPDYDPDSGMYTIHSVPSKIQLRVGNGKKTKTVELDRKGE